jgi:hypothetical protein
MEDKLMIILEIPDTFLSLFYPEIQVTRELVFRAL